MTTLSSSAKRSGKWPSFLRPAVCLTFPPFLAFPFPSSELIVNLNFLMLKI